MNVKTLRQWFTGSIILGLGVSSPALAIATSQPLQGSDRPPLLLAPHLAQQANTCRRTAYQIGVYQEPNLTSAAVGVLEAGDYLRVGSGSGGGWVRITAPSIGWVEARNLLGSDATPCPASLQPAETPATETPDLPPANQPPTTPPPSTIVNEPDSPSEDVARTAVCRVVPPEGLVVRSRPLIISATAIGSIPAGVQTFQFTNQVVTTETTEGTRQWVYILAPAEGWISPGFVGNTSNLVGAGCSVS